VQRFVRGGRKESDVGLVRLDLESFGYMTRPGISLFPSTALMELPIVNKKIMERGGRGGGGEDFNRTFR